MSDKTALVKKEEALPERSRTMPTIAPQVDIYENEEEILLHADLPGVDRQDIDINLDNGRLSLSAVRRMATAGAAKWTEFGEVEYQRTFSVPQSIDTGKINAELKEGVLHLHLPKSEAAKPRHIEIKAA